MLQKLAKFANVCRNLAKFARTPTNLQCRYSIIRVFYSRGQLRRVTRRVICYVAYD